MAVPSPKMTVEDYLAADTISERPLEYHDGEVFPVFDSTPSHARLTCNSLIPRLKGSPCSTYAALPVRINPVQYLYPDVAVVCGQLALTSETDASVNNPKVVFEILSPSTHDYDYGAKFKLYRQLSSLEEYVLLSRDEPQVEVFRRAPGQRALFTFDCPEQSLILESLSLQIPLTELYPPLP